MLNQIVAGRTHSVLMAAAVATAAGCGGSGGAGGDRRTAPAVVEHERLDPSVERALRDPAVARRLARCPVTEPNGSIPPGERTPPRPPNAYYGNGELWTVLWARGVLVGEDVLRDGTISMKFPWWRGGTGRLRITGRRLDGRARGRRARGPSGYGPTGVQSTAIDFPTQGCWEVTGRAGRASLTFVTLVLEARPQ